MTLDALLVVHRQGSGSYVANIPDGWQQGRGAFGGLVLGLMLRAVEHETDGQPLRTVDAQLLGPVLTGDAIVSVELLRKGSATAGYLARLSQGEELKVIATFLFGADRASDASWDERVPPAMAPWRDTPIAPVAPPFAPVFTQHFDYRPTGPIPFTSGLEALASGWVRVKEPGDARDSTYLLAHIDAWWPAAFARMSAPRPIATVSFFMQIMQDMSGLDSEAPLFHVARAPILRDGYFPESRELYGHDGRLLALNQQTFVIIK